MYLEAMTGVTSQKGFGRQMPLASNRLSLTCTQQNQVLVSVMGGLVDSCHSVGPRINYGLRSVATGGYDTAHSSRELCVVGKSMTDMLVDSCHSIGFHTSYGLRSIATGGYDTACSS